MKNILVTGAAGFIGSNFAEFMVNKHPEYNIVVYDKLTYAANMENLKPSDGKYTFVKGDICDFENFNLEKQSEVLVKNLFTTIGLKSIVCISPSLF